MECPRSRGMPPVIGAFMEITQFGDRGWQWEVQDEADGPR